MEGVDEKIDTSVDLSANNNKNNLLIDNLKEDKENISKRKKLSVKFKDDNISSNNININVIKAPNENKEEENEIIRTSKFKLILPIAKGGYGSVGLYKKLSTSDTYAIKTVDINYMKEKSYRHL